MIWLQLFSEFKGGASCIATRSADDSPGAKNANTGATGISGYAQVGGFIETTAEGIDYAGGCWQFIESHELFHSLGAVQESAPHFSEGGHCSDHLDVMCGQGDVVCAYPEWEGTALLPFDCNDDDYFNTNPAPGSYLATHWNVADSPFLTSETPANVVESSAADGSPCTIVGTEGDDQLEGTLAADVICGLGGNDVIAPQLGKDIVDGGSGVDTLAYPTFGAHLKIELSVSVVNGVSQGIAIALAKGAQIGNEVLYSIENTTGTSGNDEIIGSKGPNVLQGGRGSDVITARGGDDRILGGDDLDYLHGGAGNDFLDSGAGVGDNLNGGKGNDQCVRANTKEQTAYQCES